jgi:hypothetical protein
MRKGKSSKRDERLKRVTGGWYRGKEGEKGGGGRGEG